MLYFSLQGQPQSSEGAAVASAIAEAQGGFSGRATRVHVAVEQVLKIDGHWVARVRVSVEPEPDLAEEPDPAASPKEKPLQKKLKEPHYYPPPHSEPQIPASEHAPASPDHIHVYIPSSEPPDVSYTTHLIVPHPEYHYHFIGEGSLWQAAMDIRPDMDFDIASQDRGSSWTSPDPSLAPHSPEPRRRQKGMAFEIVDEEGI